MSCPYCDVKNENCNFIKGDEYSGYDRTSTSIITNNTYKGLHYQIWISESQEWDDPKSIFWLTAGRPDDEDNSIEIKYCPMCGRKLIGHDHRPK